MNNDMLICSTVILGGVCMTCCFIGHRKIKHKKELASRLRDNICYLLEQGVATFLFGDHSEFNTLCYKVVSELREVYPKFAEYTIGRIILMQTLIRCSSY